jgi:hypothetical protein
VPFQVVYKESLCHTVSTEQCHQPSSPEYETIEDVSNGGGGEYAEVRDVAVEEGMGAEPLYVELESSACEENSGCGYREHKTHCS